MFVNCEQERNLIKEKEEIVQEVNLLLSFTFLMIFNWLYNSFKFNLTPKPFTHSFSFLDCFLPVGLKYHSQHFIVSKLYRKISLAFSRRLSDPIIFYVSVYMI